MSNFILISKCNVSILKLYMKRVSIKISTDSPLKCELAYRVWKHIRTQNVNSANRVLHGPNKF